MTELKDTSFKLSKFILGSVAEERKKIRNESLIPESQSLIFCFIHPSLGAKSEF